MASCGIPIAVVCDPDTLLERYGVYIPLHMDPSRSRSSSAKTLPPQKLSQNSLKLKDQISYGGNNIIEDMEKGHRVCKMALGKRWDIVHQQLCVSRETRQIMLFRLETYSKATKPSLTIDLRHVKEVMTLEYKRKKVNIFDRWLKDKDFKQFSNSQILISAEQTSKWVRGLHMLVADSLGAPHPLLIERWLRKQFYSICDPVEQTIAQKNMKPFIQSRLQYKVSSKFMQEITDDNMSFESFAEAYRQLVHVYALFSDKFANRSLDGSHVQLEHFQSFLLEDQQECFASDELVVGEYVRSYIKDTDVLRDTQRPYLLVPEFVDYLFSRHNRLFDPAHERVSQDMDCPLSHYWIASSHNTYLTGDQLKSDSELEAYSRALLMGCRCIELDCWDPKREAGDIQIYHGFTLTTRLSLKDVLYTIKEYAFVSSQLPLILSIEDNCSVPSQRKLASNLKDILGDLLLVSAANRDERELPSPNALRGKIILKHKKLPSADGLPAPSVNGSGNTSSLSADTDLTDLDSDSEQSRRGVLWMYDSSQQRWVQRVFVLLPDRLCWSSEDVSLSFVSNDSSVNDNDDDNISMLGRLDVRPEDMHVTEEWYHGAIHRRHSEARLREHAALGNGLFLARESEVFKGDLTVTFMYENVVNHVRIKSKFTDGEKKYYFNEKMQKDTVYQLISHYQQHALQTEKFKVRLLIPCPQPTPHIGQPWYAGNIDKEQADQLLNAYPEDGAFLIRKSSQDDTVFVLSWRVDGQKLHMRLKNEGRMLAVHQTVFENLNQMVEYYSSREFWHGVCLKYPVNAATVQTYAHNVHHTTDDPGTYMEPWSINSYKECTVRSICNHVGKDDCELTFPAQAMITVFHKPDAHTWRGRYGQQVGFFPSNKVLELNSNDELKEFDYSVPLIKCVVEPIRSDEGQEQDKTSHAYLNQSRTFAFQVKQADAHWQANELRLAADSLEEMEEWMNTLTDMARRAADKASFMKSKEHDLRIASELSNLVVYCQAVPFNPMNIPGNFYEMCSFSETKFPKLVERGLINFNRTQLSRVYPKANRVNSTNYDPVPMWNTGCQMIALNYQTADRSMQLNQGRFLANGRCGYVLKPSYMRHDAYEPDKPDAVPPVQPITLTIHVIAGRHLMRDVSARDRDKTRGIVSPVVEIEVVGLPCDSRTLRTRTITGNGLHPVWNESFEFNLNYPEMALLRFYVQDDDFVRTDPFIGQTTLPVPCIRNGYRSVPLCNAYSEELELAALLVHVETRTQVAAEQQALRMVMPNNPQSIADSRARSLGTEPSTSDDDSAHAGVGVVHSRLHANTVAGDNVSTTSSLSTLSPLATASLAPDTPNSLSSHSDKSKKKKNALSKGISKLFGGGSSSALVKKSSRAQSQI